MLNANSPGSSISEDQQRNAVRIKLVAYGGRDNILEYSFGGDGQSLSSQAHVVMSDGEDEGYLTLLKKYNYVGRDFYQSSLH